MNEIAIVATLFVVLLAGAVFRARTAKTTRSRLTIRWADAWLKSAVIVVGIALFVVYIPAEVMGLDVVTGLDRTVQDLVGAGVWGAGLLGSLAALTWAQRREYV